MDAQRLVLVIVVVAVAALAAAVIQRRRSGGEPVQAGWSVPARVDRAGLPRPEAEWALVLFTSATCDTCAGAVTRARALDGPDLAVVEVEVGEEPELHRRYAIDAVPTMVLADAAGVVHLSHVGPMSTAELWSAVADVRDQRSTA